MCHASDLIMLRLVLRLVLVATILQAADPNKPAINLQL